MNTLPTTTETEAAFRMGIAASPERWLDPTGPKSVPYIVNPITGTPESLEHLLLKPVRKSDCRKFQSTLGFIDYVNRFKEKESSIYLSGHSVIAELDHRNAEGDLAAGHHKAVIEYSPTTAFKRWTENNLQELSQVKFADLLEERGCDITKPESASMIEIAQALHITKNSAVSSVTRQGVNHHITFSDEQKVRGGNDADIPSVFELHLVPFMGSAVTLQLKARLRVSMKSDKPAFIYELQDLQERILEALDTQVNEIAKATKLPAYI